MRHVPKLFCDVFTEALGRWKPSKVVNKYHRKQTFQALIIIYYIKYLYMYKKHKYMMSVSRKYCIIKHNTDKHITTYYKQYLWIKIKKIPFHPNGASYDFGVIKDIRAE